MIIKSLSPSFILYVLVVVFAYFNISHVQSIDWQQGEQVWAMHCDFLDNDLTNAQTSGEQCGNTCDANLQCTHFTWTNYNGGTCWLKSGQASKSDAFYSNEPSSVCGFANRGDGL
jgi:hypothetical protein